MNDIKIKTGWLNLWNDFLRLTENHKEFTIIKINQSNGLQVYWNKHDDFLFNLSEELHKESLKTCEETGCLGELITVNGKNLILNSSLRKKYLQEIS